MAEFASPPDEVAIAQPKEVVAAIAIKLETARHGQDQTVRYYWLYLCDVCCHGAESKNNYGFGKVSVR